MSRNNRGTARRGNRGGRDSSNRVNARGGSNTRSRKFQYVPRSSDQVKDRQDRAGNDREDILVKGVDKFAPHKGDNCIRILPPTWDDAEHFGLDVYVHYGVGSDNGSFLCPRMMKTGDCCICEERKQAEADGDEDYMRKLAYSHRVLYYLLDRDDEKKGVQVWAAPFASIDKNVTAQTRDSRSGEILNIDDPDEGYDVEFTKEGEKERTKYSGVRVVRHSSDLGRDQDEYLETVMETPLTDLLVHASNEHIENVFFGSVPSNKNKKLDEADEWEKIHEMSWDELDDLIDEERLNLDSDDFKSEFDLADEVCNELGIEELGDTNRTDNKVEESLNRRRRR